MNYQQHNLTQGTPEWHSFRSTHHGASEAAAMLGLSKYTSRSELLRQKYTGISKEIDSNTQSIFDRGHETEALARPIIETEIGEQLSPVTLSKGKLSCSCDGLTFDDSIAWEHKQWNAALAESVERNELPDTHMPQCQQILFITGAEKLLFTVSDGTSENMVSMEVLPNTVWFYRIITGWDQFDKDLENYQHVEHVEKPKADAIIDLPALSVQATGMVTYSNLPEFKAAAENYIANINTELVTDQQFSDAEATVKFCKTTEETLEVTKKAILAQTSSIDEVIRTVDHIQAQLRDKRLMLDKLVKSEKEARKLAIVQAAIAKFGDHINSLESEIKPIRLCIICPDFGLAIKGKKLLSAMKEAVDTELRNGIFHADAVAKDVRAKLSWCKDNAAGMSFLFPDLQQIIAKPMEDFMLTITSRIKEHKEAEARKEAEIIAKAEADAAAKLNDERAKMEAEVKAKAEEDQRAKQQVSERESEVRIAQDQVAERQSSPPNSNDVVIEQQDVISAFIASHNFAPKDVSRFRAILVEFVKFSAQFENDRMKGE